MFRRDDMFNLTKRERDIMIILWKANQPMTASQIAKSKEGLAVSTVQFNLRKLLSKDLIKIDQVVKSGKVLCRSYIPSISMEKFEAEHLVNNFCKSEKQVSVSCLIASFLDKEKDRESALAKIEELEDLLKRKKLELKEKEE